MAPRRNHSAPPSLQVCECLRKANPASRCCDGNPDILTLEQTEVKSQLTIGYVEASMWKIRGGHRRGDRGKAGNILALQSWEASWRDCRHRAWRCRPRRERSFALARLCRRGLRHGVHGGG